MSEAQALFSKHKIVVCAVLLILGITAAQQMPSAYYAAAASLPFLMTVVRLRKTGFLIFFPLGLILPFFDYEAPDPALVANEGRRAVVTGWLYENAQKRPGSVKIPLKVETVSHSGEDLRADGKIIVYSNGLDNLAYGDSVRAPLRIRRAEDFKNPGNTGYAERLASKGVFFTAYSDSAKIKTGKTHESANPILRLANGLRRNYAVFIRKNLPQAQAEILNSLSIGEKGAVPEHLKRKFSAVGIGHLFAISELRLCFSICL